MSIDSVIKQKSMIFARRIVKLYQYLNKEHREFVMSKQILRSGTSIGANVAESQQAQSRADFVSKLSIALKEAVETNYWLRLLYASEYLTEPEFSSVFADCRELEKMLTSIVKTSCNSSYKSS